MMKGKKEKQCKRSQGKGTEGQRINTTYHLKTHNWTLFQFHKTTGEIGFYVRSNELTQFDNTSKVNARPVNGNFLSCIRFKPEKRQTLTLPDCSLIVASWTVVYDIRANNRD